MANLELERVFPKLFEQLLMPSDYAKQRKLPKYNFAENVAFVTHRPTEFSTKKKVTVHGSEKLVSYGDRHFVSTRPKATVDSSGKNTGKLNETVLRGQSPRRI